MYFLFFKPHGEDKRSAAQPQAIFSVIPKTKNALVPYGNKDRKLCGATLFAGINRPLCPVPTHRLPVNAGNASEDTKAKPVLPALGGPFAAPLFAPLSALGNSLWMRLQLYFRVFGFLFKLCLLNTKSVFLSRTFFHTRRTNFKAAPHNRARRFGERF